METKQKFLQLQFCTLLVVCTLLPDLGSLVGSLIGMPDFDIPVFCCQIIGIVGGGLALYSFYNNYLYLSWGLQVVDFLLLY